VVTYAQTPTAPGNIAIIRSISEVPMTKNPIEKTNPIIEMLKVPLYAHFWSDKNPIETIRVRIPKRMRVIL
jgi:hypothetical protein